MKEQFSTEQLSRIVDQSLVYQCACPAQVCRALFEMRELYDYQMNCVSGIENDRKVHEAIALATEKTHAVMEECLKQVLVLEGWNEDTLIMPDLLKEKAMRAL